MTRAHLALFLVPALLLPACGKDTPPSPTPAENMPASATGAPRPADGAARYDLPRDLERLTKDTGLVVAGKRYDLLVLHFSRVPAALEIHLPVGVKAIPAEPAKMAPFAVRKSGVYTIAPGARTPRLEIPVVNCEAKIWKDPEERDRFTLAPADADSLLTRFLARADASGAEWNAVQTGVWMILHDLSHEEVSKNRVQMSTTYFFAPDLSWSGDFPVAHFESVKAAARLLAGLGVESSSFRLYREHQAMLEELLGRLDFDRPALNWQIMIKDLDKTYKAEPRIEALLVRYLTEHPAFHVRDDVLKSLVRSGLIGDTESLLDRAENAEYAVRFAAALTLLSRKDPRAYPLLAPFERNPYFAPHFAAYFRSSLKEKTGAPPRDDESLADYWNRVVGWETLARECGDVAAVRRIVERHGGEPDPWLAQLCTDLRSPEPERVGSALNALESRYAARRDAFDAVARAACEHEDAKIRIRLVDALNRFSAADPKPVFERILAGDPDPSVAQRVVYQVVTFGKFDGREAILEHASRHPAPEVRVEVVNQLARRQKQDRGDEAKTLSLVSRLALEDANATVRKRVMMRLDLNGIWIAKEAAEETLLRAAEHDPDGDVRIWAVKKLAEGKSRRALPILQRWLGGSVKPEKQEAASGLMRFGGDAEALDLLEPFRDDPDAGLQRMIRHHLKRNGR